MAEAFTPGASGVVAQAQPAAFAVVRGDLQAADFRAALAAAGLSLPETPCTFMAAAATAANAATAASTTYWLGPDEWLLAAPGEPTAPWPPPLAAGVVVDVSGAYLRWRLTGASVRSVLRKATSYDVHPRAFPPGRCAQTALAKATALVAAHPNDAFELIVRRSYGDYVQRFLALAGEEFGIAFVGARDVERAG